MKKKSVSMLLATAMVMSLLTGCGSKNNSAADTTKEETQTEATAEAAADESNDTTADDAGEETTITVFAAKSLNQVMEELITKFQETHPNVNVQGSYDSSGTLLTQIEEGAACDVFFSAAVKQMDQLDETDGLVVDGTRHNVVNNQVCLVTYKESNTEVTSLEDLNKASSIALADGSVPVGKYTRQALVNAGILEKADDVSIIPTATVSEALGGVEIIECANVGAVTSSVAEGSNEVGTVYYSDTYGLEDRLEILQGIPYDLTGDVIYPVAQVQNPEAEELEPFFKEIFEHAEYTLSRTPEMLPVLKEAGVVDSGGQGLLEVFRGAFDGYLGKEIDYSAFEKVSSGPAVTRISQQAEADIKF